MGGAAVKSCPYMSAGTTFFSLPENVLCLKKKNILTFLHFAGLTQNSLYSVVRFQEKPLDPDLV